MFRHPKFDSNNILLPFFSAITETSCDIKVEMLARLMTKKMSKKWAQGEIAHFFKNEKIDNP